MNPLLELQKLMGSGSTRLSGSIVVVLANNTYRVRTVIGLVEVKGISSIFKEGDEVLLDGAVIVGKLKNPGTIPVYNV